MNSPILTTGVDLIRDLIDEPQKFNPDGQPLSFVFAFEGKHIRDVTKRFASLGFGFCFPGATYCFELPYLPFANY
jgi:hypothetical protein